MSRLTLSLISSLFSSFAQQVNDATDRLTNQSEQFEEQIIKITGKVYTAVGFSVSNVSMIVDDDDVVIVDMGMMLDDANRIATEFRKLSDKPVKAIIFSHAHGDHTGGAATFLGSGRTHIWAHQNFGREARLWMNGNLTIQNVRGARQAWFKLPPDQRINNGIAPVLYPKRGALSSGRAKQRSSCTS